MNQIGIKFVLQQSFLQVLVTESEANVIIDGFLKGTLAPRIGNSASGWAIATEDIKAVHMVPLDAFQPQVAGRPWFGGASGLPN